MCVVSERYYQDIQVDSLEYDRSQRDTGDTRSVKIITDFWFALTVYVTERQSQVDVLNIAGVQLILAIIIILSSGDNDVIEFKKSFFFLFIKKNL